MTITTQEFIQRAISIHGDTYDYKKFKYVNWDTKSTIICPIHGEFDQKPRQHIERRSGCKLCGHIKQSASKSISEEDFIQRSIHIHSNKYDYSKLGYINLSSPVVIICPNHGPFRFEHAYAHTSNQSGCGECAREQHRKDTDYFIQKSKDIYDNAFSYENASYVTTDTPLIVTCKQHGNQSITPTDHYRVGCWMCKRNRMQDIWLDELNIPNTKEHRQVRLIIQGKLHVVDGFDLTTNTVFLFHGDFWHGNPILYNSTDINKRNGQTFGELYINTIKYEKRLTQAGYKVNSVWELDWKQQSNSVEYVDEC